MITQNSIMNKLLRKQGKRSSYLRPLHYGKLTSEYLLVSIIFEELEKQGLVTVHDERTQIWAALTLKGMFWQAPKPTAEFLEKVRAGEAGEVHTLARSDNTYFVDRTYDILTALQDKRYVIWSSCTPFIVELTELGKKEWQPWS